MTTMQIAMGAISIVITIAAYVRYINLAVRAEIKPHPFSWILWGLVTAIAYHIQSRNGAGAGGWVTGVTAFACIVIAIVGWNNRLRPFSLIDWFSFASGLFAISYYAATGDPMKSALWATFADATGYISTFRDGWSHPKEEDPTSFALNGVKFLVALPALSSQSIATCAYPVTIALFNLSVAAMLQYRRKSMASNT